MDLRYAYGSIAIFGLLAIGMHFSSAARAYPAPLIFNTNLRPPYQVLEDGKLSGHTVQAMHCISQHLKQNWQLNLTPWARALHNLKAGTISGLFPVYNTPEAGRLSAPLAVERWFWYSTRVTNYYDRKIKIGAVRDSNEHHWLQSHKIKVSLLVSEEAQLVRLLQQGRIDGFVSNELSVAYWVDSEKIDTQHWQRRFVRFTPLYLALAEDPAPAQSWVDAINYWAGQCAQGTTRLTDDEKATLSGKLQTLIQGLPLEDIHALVAKEQAQLTAQQLSQREVLWQSQNFQSLNFIDQHLSKKLRDFVTNNAELVSEAFVMGKQGETLASDQKLSDYWQGDEDKFLEAHNLASGAFFIEAIAYDASSQAFVAHVSWPIYLQGQLEGTITLGVRVEQLLTHAP